MFFNKNLLIILLTFIIYIYRFSKLENGLFRVNSENKKKLCLKSLYSGIIGPFKSSYFTLRYCGFSTFIKTSYKLFLTLDNPFFILIFLKIILNPF